MISRALIYKYHNKPTSNDLDYVSILREILRSQMPQITTVNLPKALKLLQKSTGLKGSTVELGKLRPTQTDTNMKDARDRSKEMTDPLKLKPIIVSNDLYIIDGHTRAKGAEIKFGKSAKVSVIIINQPKLKALKLFSSIARKFL